MKLLICKIAPMIPRKIPCPGTPRIQQCPAFEQPGRSRRSGLAHEQFAERAALLEVPRDPAQDVRTPVAAPFIASLFTTARLSLSTASPMIVFDCCQRMPVSLLTTRSRLDSPGHLLQRAAVMIYHPPLGEGQIVEGPGCP